MLCEGRLLSMMFSDLEELDCLPPKKSLKGAHGPPRAAAALTPGSTRHSPLIHYNSPEQTEGVDRNASVELYISPLQSLDLEGAHPCRHISPQIEIPAQAHSGGEVPFLVPPFCQSICENYSDLHIGGDQVLPLSANNGELQLCTDAQPPGPFLQSCDVLPPVEDSPPAQIPQNGLLHPLRGGSNRWRQTSARDRSFPGPICNLLGSELVLTSLEQITLQLSRDGNLEAGLAKDMVLSCLLRVAGDMQSSEISTPFLQISNEASREQLSENKEE